MDYIGYTDLVFNPETGEWLAPASVAHNHSDYPGHAQWDSNGYLITSDPMDGERYFEGEPIEF